MDSKRNTQDHVMYKGCFCVIVFLCVREEDFNSSGSSFLLATTGCQFLSVCSVLLVFS